jgi:acid phosphatase family membrane protein YuiD
MRLDGILSNDILWISVLAWFVAQCIKILVNLAKFKRFDFKLIISSGGMPSSHSSFVTSMAVSVGERVGYDSPLFAMSVILSLVVMYDAAGVRRAAGQQAALLNKIMDEFLTNTLNIEKRLKELLGHTPVEVAAGAVLGIVIALVLR